MYSDNSKGEWLVMMLFDTSMFLIAGGTIALALLDKTLSSYGFHMLGTTLKIIIPLIAMALGVYFIETNPILGWLK